MADTTLPGLLLSGLAAGRPAASAVGSGALYVSTDTGVIEQSDGSSWSTWATLGTAGAVTGPGSSTNDDFVTWNGAGGDTLQDSGLSLDTDGTLAADSDAKIPSQKAVKTYADQLLGAAQALEYKGATDCSGNPNYPAGAVGDLYMVSVSGKIGGASGTSVTAGDLFICVTANGGGTQAAVGADWDVVHVNATGSVTGAGSSTAHDLVGFADTTGAVLEDSGVKVDTDTALAADSAARIPTQHAVKTYVDAALAGGGGGTGFVLADSGGEETLNTVASSTASLTVDAADGNVHDITLTADCTFTLSAVTSGKGCTITLLLRQDGTGGRTVTWPASVSWLGGTGAPVLQTAASAVDVVTLFTVDGGTTWLGFAASEFMADWRTAIAGTCTYASATTFTCSGDQRTVFRTGGKLRIKQTTLKYFVVASQSYNAGTDTTTVTITGGSDYSLANAALSEVLISELEYPTGWPGWFNFAAAVTNTSSDASVSRFCVIGRTVLLALNLSGTSTGTSHAITLPITPANISGIQWIIAVTVKDNNVVQSTPGELVINPNNASASVYKTSAAGSWTGSNPWFAIGPGSYEI